MNENQITLRYQLTKEEAYEAFYLLASRRSKTVRLSTSGVLTVLTVVLLILYALDTRKIHMLFLAVCAIAMLFYILYEPALRAKKGARMVEKASGRYRITLLGDGRLILPDGGILKLNGDKYARIVETNTVFAMRPDAQHTICIPKRILSYDEVEFIRGLRTSLF